MTPGSAPEPRPPFELPVRVKGGQLPSDVACEIRDARNRPVTSVYGEGAREMADFIAAALNAYRPVGAPPREPALNHDPYSVIVRMAKDADVEAFVAFVGECGGSVRHRLTAISALGVDLPHSRPFEVVAKIVRHPAVRDVETNHLMHICAPSSPQSEPREQAETGIIIEALRHEARRLRGLAGERGVYALSEKAQFSSEAETLERFAKSLGPREKEGA